MLVTSLQSFVLTASMVLVATGVAAADGALKSVHDDWQVRCDTPAGAQGEQCALTQSVIAEDKTDVWLRVSVLRTAKSRLMRVVAPLGVLLPLGLRLKIDQVDVERAGFVRYLPNGCVAEVVMDDNLLKQLRSGQTATFIIFQSPEEGIGFPINLKGFGEGFDSLPTVPCIYEFLSNLIKMRSSLANLLCRFSTRGHRSEIMLGVLVVVFCPDYIAGLGLCLG